MTKFLTFLSFIFVPDSMKNLNGHQRTTFDKKWRPTCSCRPSSKKKFKDSSKKCLCFEWSWSEKRQFLAEKKTFVDLQKMRKFVRSSLELSADAAAEVRENFPRLETIKSPWATPTPTFSSPRENHESVKSHGSMLVRQPGCDRRPLASHSWQVNWMPQGLLNQANL